jgi:hypothetical protein
MTVRSTNEVVGFLAHTTQQIDEGLLPPGYAAFVVAYHAFTLEILAKLTSGVFASPVRMSDFVVRFCARYERALADRPRAARPWQLAFASAEANERPVIRNLLLGASAHMSYDLCAVILDLLAEHDPDAIELDVLAINHVIERGIAPVQRALAMRSSYAALLAGFGAGLDDLLTWRMFASWRHGAWHSARTVAAGRATLADVETRIARRAAALRRFPL